MMTKDSGAYCGSGGCGKRDTYDWMSEIGLVDVDGFNMVEVSFKKGTHKAFFRNPPHLQAVTGDMVVVSAGNGYDIGQITLSGEMVKLQMLKKKVKKNEEFERVKGLANSSDLSKLEQARSIEISTMIRARAIVNSLGLKMKIGDVRYQGDLRQATFYYIAEGRVDFRELIKVYANDFKIRIKMMQVGARQESALIGGLGSCGRELCCSTWLTDLKTVSTAALRYQNLSFNQEKLSGQCGRLKCCLNYELDFYVDATRGFPKNARKLKTGAGIAKLIKTDIFRKVMYYAYDSERGRGKLYGIPPAKAKEIVVMNRKGEEPASLVNFQMVFNVPTEEEKWDYDTVGQVVELPPEERKKRRRKKKRNKKRPSSQSKRTPSKKKEDAPSNSAKPKNKKAKPKRNTTKKTDSNNPKITSKVIGRTRKPATRVTRVEPKKKD